MEQSPSDTTRMTEAERFIRLSSLVPEIRNGVNEEIRMSPLMTLAVKDFVKSGQSVHLNEDHGLREDELLHQYALLGFHCGIHANIGKMEPILMNVAAPYSTFICGSQGSGKSYTLSCILENCLRFDTRVGTVKRPLAGLAFHFDSDSANGVAEIGHLCSLGIQVNVLVSQSNETNLRSLYHKIPGATQYMRVQPLLFRSEDLTLDRMHALMAFADKDGGMPLYMSVVLRILRNMAIGSQTASSFNYAAFRAALNEENLTKEQCGPLNLRLELLESFLSLDAKKSRSVQENFLDIKPGTLTIVDLTDPFMDPATACVLFEICLSVVKQRRQSDGIVVALDEAHKFMNSSPAATNFSEKLIGTIREQRHNAIRVVIATQEPTISGKLLDLCTVSIVHRFSSPAWFSTLKTHLGAAATSTTHSHGSAHISVSDIMELSTGQSLVFAPTAFVKLSDDGAPSKLAGDVFYMQTRIRLSTDGGLSILAPARNLKPDTGFVNQSDATVPGESKSSNVQAISLRGPNSNGPPGVSSSNVSDASISSGCKIPDNIQKPKQSSSAPLYEGHDLAPSSKWEISHLALVCCTCRSVALMHFERRTLPSIKGVRDTDQKFGLAYMTCAECRDKVASTSKSASKFDFAQLLRLGQGEITLQADGVVQSLEAHYDTPVVTLTTDDGNPSYLFHKTILSLRLREDMLSLERVHGD